MLCLCRGSCCGIVRLCGSGASRLPGCAKEIGGITVTIYSETNDLDLTVEPFTESGGGYKFTATPPEEGEYTYAWYVDGVSESDAGSTENEFTFRKVNGDGSLVVKGVYDIKVEVKKSGSTKWSAFAQAKVE